MLIPSHNNNLPLSGLIPLPKYCKATLACKPPITAVVLAVPLNWHWQDYYYLSHRFHSRHQMLLLTHQTRKHSIPSAFGSNNANCPLKPIADADSRGMPYSTLIRFNR